MTYILGLGSPSDPCALRLDTRKRWHINNVPGKQDPREVIQAKVEAILCAFPGVKLLSASSVYNCYGLVFASRRTRVVDERDVWRILQDDEFVEVPMDPAKWEIGDVVLYKKPEDEPIEIKHVATIVEKKGQLETGECEVWVVSAWGDHGEYFHLVDDVHPMYGCPSKVFSQRIQ